MKLPTPLEMDRFAKPRTVLVVEDDPLILALSTTILKKAGYRVLSSVDGVDGSVIFARNFQEIDLLVTDISLPGMRGPELAQFARKIRSDIKILFASGSIHLEGPSLLNLVEGAAYLAKPFTSEQLLDSVRTLIFGQSAHPANRLFGAQTFSVLI